MQYGFLIIKLQTALHHAVWCSVVHYYLRCSMVMPFYGRFCCDFFGLCGLMNTPSCLYKRGDGSFKQLIEFFTYVWYYKEQHTKTYLPISHQFYQSI